MLAPGQVVLAGGRAHGQVPVPPASQPVVDAGELAGPVADVGHGRGAAGRVDPDPREPAADRGRRPLAARRSPAASDSSLHDGKSATIRSPSS